MGIPKNGMTITVNSMTISVTELKARLLEIVREVEREGTAVDVERHGKIVARIVPATPKRVRPWEALYGSAVFLGDPEESVWDVDPNSQGKRKGKGKR